jgi:hypothetical protein
MTIEQLMVRIQDLENQVSDLKNQREPATLQFKLNYTQTAMDTINNKINELEAFVEKFNTEDKWVEIFTKEEIKSLYKQSGLVLTDIQGFIGKLYGRTDITLENASLYIEQGYGDIRAISRLGKYLRGKVLKNVKQGV